MINEYLNIAMALIAGVLLGTVFFGGLWWTVRKCASSKNPGLLFFGSFLLRMGFVLAGFYFIARGHWENLLICLLGFIIARILVMRFTHVFEQRDYLTKETGNAS